MPRKNRTPASQALNRENQRRSRERRRDFINDLQQRLLVYERQGAQATFEMQQVARAVAAENDALRALIAAKNIPREEVDAYLASKHAGTTQNTAFQAKSGLVSSHGSSRHVEIEGAPKEQPKHSKQPSPPTVPLSSQSLGILLVATIASQNELRCSHSTLQESTSDYLGEERRWQATCTYAGESDNDSNSFYVLSMDTACYCPPDPPQEHPLKSNGMPCLEAAIILSQIKGHHDPAFVQAKLGCAEGVECIVQNTDVLQLMDEMT